MNYLHASEEHLTLEGVSLADIAARYGTPTYVYSRAAIEEAFNQYADALGGHAGLICYALKANSNLAILNLLARLGAGFDIVSVGELERVLSAGGDPKKIIFSGVGKSQREIERALEVSIACFNVESEAELERLAAIAANLGKIAPVSLRINPDVDANTHPYISTGLKSNKFGIDINTAESLYKRAQQLPGLRPLGIDCHIGSQLNSVAPLLEACDRLLALYDKLIAQDIHIEHLDLGGGLGVRYHDETEPDIADYVTAIKQRLGNRPLTLMFEPGRSIVANAGLLLTRVEYLKPTAHLNFAVVDAAMNDLIRPALYQAWQNIVPVNLANDAEKKTWDIVGPVCESADFLGKGRELSLGKNSLLAILSSGAYSFVMSSNYNSRPRAAEVMVDGDTIHLVRERETIDDLMRGEHMLPRDVKSGK